LANLLGEKLACVLFQLPPFIQKKMELLEKIASQVDINVTNVVEFRHESWWNSEVYDFMQKKGLVFCSVSASQLPETLVKTAPDIYVRFHGKDGLYRSMKNNLGLKKWCTIPKVFCYFNNDQRNGKV
jgi:uncharacterized protein YecE (DUF72 family)